MAAEAAAMATGYDKAIWLRTLVSRLLRASAGAAWAQEIGRVPQITWQNCWSLAEMLAKETPAATEKRVLLDIFDLKQYLHEDDVEWVATGHQLADLLTKHFGDSVGSKLRDWLESGVVVMPPSPAFAERNVSGRARVAGR